MRNLAVILLSSTAALLPAAAMAQATSSTPTTASTEQAPPGDIVVTAERRSGSLQKTPLAVSAFTSKGLQDLQINKTTDLQRYVPSLQASQGTVDQTTLTVFMRGAGQNAGTWFGYESAVGLYVDDIYVAALTGANLDLADLERVEVLRGPQGTLYGRNTLTGAIKYVTKKPSTTPFGDFEAEYGSYHDARFKGTVSMPISPDWAVLATGNYYHRDGYSNAPALHDKSYGDNEQYGARAAIQYTGDAPYGVYASAFYSKATNEGSIGLATNATTLQPGTSNIYDYLSTVRGVGRSESYGSAATLSADLGDHAKIKSITGVIQSKEYIHADLSGGNYLSGATGNYVRGSDVLTSNVKRTQWSQEVQLLGDAMNNRLHYIGGVYFFRETGFQNRQDDYLATGLALPQHVNLTTTSYAGYGQLTYDLTSKLSFVGGLRWSHERKTVDGYTPASTTSSAYVPIGGSTTAESWTPKFGINFQATPTILAYFSASRGFQAGGFNYLVLANPTAYETAYKPQTVWAYEFGLKTQFLDRKGRFNLALYRNDFSNLQTNVLLSTGSSVTQNAGTARVQGVEGELNFTPIHGLTLFGTGAYSHSQYLDISTSSYLYRTGQKDLPNVPKWQLSAGANGSIETPKGAFLYGADWSYMASKWLSVTNTAITHLPSYTLVNAFIGFHPAGSKLEARLSVSNLLKEKYYVYTNGSGIYGLRSPGEPRMAKVQITYHY